MIYGIDIGGSKIELSVFDEQLASVRTYRDGTPRHDYRRLLHVLSSMIEKADRDCGRASLVGIGFPGYVDSMQRAVTSNIPCVTRKPFIRDIGKLASRDIFVSNDLRAFTVSESVGGAGEGYERVLGVILGTGVGSCLCINREPLGTCGGVAGEWGHVPISALAVSRHDLPLFKCGCSRRACYETYVSGPGLSRLHAHFGGRDASAENIWIAYRDGERAARRAVHCYMDILADGVSMQILHYDPDVIVLGGGMSVVPELYEQVTDAIRSRSMKGAATSPIVPPVFGAASGARGAALLARRQAGP